MFKNQKVSIEGIIRIALMATVLVFTLIMVISAGYSYLCEDDYSFICGARDFHDMLGSNTFNEALHAAYRYYCTNQGTYLFNFLVYYINPYVRWGLPGLHMVMVANVLLFVGSAWYCAYSLIKDKLISWIYIAAFVVTTFGGYYTFGNKELFLWYTGALNYTLEISCSFVALGIMIKLIEGEKRVHFFLIAMLMAFAGSGGALEVTAVNCAALLMVLVMNLSKLKQRKLLVLPFLASFAGALINALAKSNFNRSDAYIKDGHKGVGVAIIDTLICLKRENQVLLSSALFVFMILSIMIVVLMAGKLVFKGVNIKLIQVILAWVVCFTVQFLAVFPITFGFHTSNLDSMRTIQSFYIIAATMYLFAATVTGLYFRRFDKKIGYVIMAVSMVLVIVTGLLAGEEKSDFKQGHASCVVRDLKSGNLVNNYKVRSHIISTIDVATEGSDVIMFEPYYACESVYGMGIGEDPNSLVNDTIENWKKINSLTVYYLGLTYPPAEE